MYRQASRESRDGSTMGTARAEERGREPARTLRPAAAGNRCPHRPALHRRPHPADLRPGGETPGYLTFDFSQIWRCPRAAGKAEAALRQAGTVEDAVEALEGRIDRDAPPMSCPRARPSCNRRTSAAAPAATTLPSTLTGPIVADALRRSSTAWDLHPRPIAFSTSRSSIPRWARAPSWSKPAASSPGSWSKSGTRMAGRRRPSQPVKPSCCTPGACSELLGRMPPAAFEAHYYHPLHESAMAAWLKQTTFRETRDGSARAARAVRAARASREQGATLRSHP